MMKKLSILFLAILLLAGCADESGENGLIAPQSDKISMSDEQPAGQANNARTALTSACSNPNRIEIDVRSENPEAPNPQNYTLELRRNGRLSTVFQFDQYCTLNNTFTKLNPTAAVYTYKITSTCTSRVYEGTINYQAGYYGTVVYISQSSCE